MMKGKFINLFTLLGVVILFTTCKRYPENTLWFKNPEKIPFIVGNMTHWIVNGVDSIDFLDNYFYNDINNNSYSHKFSNLQFVSRKLSKGYYEVFVDKPSDYAQIDGIINDLEYTYLDKGKKLKLYHVSQITNSFGKNIFISGDIIWDIVYLGKKDKKRKIKGTYNGNVYEIQFN